MKLLSITISAAFLGIWIFTPQETVAQSYDAPGSRTFQDSRVPQNDPKKRIIIRKKKTEAAPQNAPQENQNPGDDQEAVQTIEQLPEDTPDINDAEKGGQTISESEEEAILRELDELDDGTLTEAEIRELEERTGRTRPEPRETKESRRISAEQFKSAACPQICNLVKEQDACLDKCEKKGFCGLSFIECDRKGNMKMNRDVVEFKDKVTNESKEEKQ